MFNHLKYKRIFENFKEISDIPRCSYHEERVSNFLCDKIKALGLECVQEKCGNIIAKKPASKGYEDHEAVILQAHMDMVCVKSKDSQHDFSKDPIELILEGDILRANETTLGADNGIGVAMILTVLEDKSLQHPPITAFITVAEETGMDGAILADYSLLKGNRLINLDSEEDTSITVACSGGADFVMNYPIQYEDSGSFAAQKTIQAFEINISGISGGHSGIDINKKGACAIKLLNRFLLSLDSMRLFEISGGIKRNAIATTSHCKLVTEMGLQQIRESAERMQAIFRSEYSEKDPDIQIEVVEISSPAQVFTRQTSANLLKLLAIMPHGVAAMTQHMSDLVETSCNLAILEQKGDVIEIATSIRSSLKSKVDEMLQRMKIIADLFDTPYRVSDGYPAWEFKPQNQLLETMKVCYHEVYQREADVISIHAGLECAFFAQKLPNADMISFGPNIYNPHSVDERTEISSIEKNYEFLLAGLKAL